MYEFTLVFGVVLWTAVLAGYARHPAASAFHPATYYLFFQGLIFVVRPVLAHLQDFAGLYGVYRFQPTEADKVVALLAADLAFVVFVAASLRFGPDRFDDLMARRRHSTPAPTFDWALGATVALCAPPAIASLVADLREKASGLSTMILDDATGYKVNTSANGYFADAQLMLPTLCLLIAWIGRLRAWSLLPLGVYVFARAATGGRGPFILSMASLMVLFLLTRGRRWLAPRLVWLAAVGAVLFTTVGMDRGAGLRAFFANVPQAEVVDDLNERPLESMDYGNMEFMEYLVTVVPGKTGTYTYFTDLAQLVTEPVPRVLWPGKPVGPPFPRFSLFDYGTPVGMTNSVAGMGWVSLGWLGVVIYALGFGWFYGRLYRLFARRPDSVGVTVAYVILLPLSLVAFRDGSVLTIAKSSLFTLLPVIIWRVASRVGSPEEPVPPRAAVAAPTALRRRIEARRRELA